MCCGGALVWGKQLHYERIMAKAHFARGGFRYRAIQLKRATSSSLCALASLFLFPRLSHAKSKTFSIKWIFHCIRNNHIVISCSIVARRRRQPNRRTRSETFANKDEGVIFHYYKFIWKGFHPFKAICCWILRTVWELSPLVLSVVRCQKHKQRKASIVRRVLERERQREERIACWWKLFNSKVKRENSLIVKGGGEEGRAKASGENRRKFICLIFNFLLSGCETRAARKCSPIF